MKIEQIDPAHPDAQLALQSYLSEVAARIGGPAAISVDEAVDVGDYRPPHGAFLVARSGDGSVVGCGALRALSPELGELKRMWVSTAARGRGYGRQLLEALEAEARQRGFAALRLDTNAVLVEAIALYERHGYDRVARYNDNPDATEFFEKKLS